MSNRQRFVDAETYEACVRALMPYEDEIKSEKHRAMARQNRERDVNTIIATMLSRGWAFSK